MMIEEQLLFSFPFLATLVFCIVILVRISIKIKWILVVVTVLLSVFWFWHRPQYLLNRWRMDPFDDSSRSIVAFGLRAHAYGYEEFLSEITFYRPILYKVLLKEPNPKLRIRAALFLGYSKNQSDRETLIYALDDSQFGVRLAASLALLPKEYMWSSKNFLAYGKFCLLMKQDEHCDPDEKTIRAFVDLMRSQMLGVKTR
ncbi:HEAT repeat domain-containing protein [Leptospira barantonii]|uniref:HEAT repeat domain-containing protein n=1 Tax=Leptospira barantonii TaxID=2023184 RepID=A0A5F2B058_9LEPT|nr:HEAT repeat domain-containing protein [Leptospira barantonii]TGL97528.1 HEAT repeat domain-containing protein [Leptospira barantonii]